MSHIATYLPDSRDAAVLEAARKALKLAVAAITELSTRCSHGRAVCALDGTAEALGIEIGYLEEVAESVADDEAEEPCPCAQSRYDANR